MCHPPCKCTHDCTHTHTHTHTHTEHYAVCVTSSSIYHIPHITYHYPHLPQHRYSHYSGTLKEVDKISTCKQYIPQLSNTKHTEKFNYVTIAIHGILHHSQLMTCIVSPVFTGGETTHELLGAPSTCINIHGNTLEIPTS